MHSLIKKIAPCIERAELKKQLHLGSVTRSEDGCTIASSLLSPTVLHLQERHCVIYVEKKNMDSKTSMVAQRDSHKVYLHEEFQLSLSTLVL